MRHENAVSEVIGAVLLIGVVMVGIGIIGVIMLSTPPPDKTPKASITTYGVQCDMETPPTYEVIMYHGGGESLKKELTKFYLQTRDGSQELVEPWWVYTRTPTDCMFGDIDPHSDQDYWNNLNEWKSGETLRFRFTSDSEPSGINIQYYPYKTPMVRTDFKDVIKKSPCVETNRPAECINPMGELIPVLHEVICDPNGCSSGSCKAVFKYKMIGNKITIPVHKGGKPWNYFHGGTGSFDYSEFSESGSENDLITVTFSDNVQWWLGRTKSEIAKCE